MSVMMWYKKKFKNILINVLHIQKTILSLQNTKSNEMTTATKLTIEQVKNDSMRNYNPTEWIKIVNRYSQFSNVEFYKVEKNKIYSYDRFFIKYELSDGLILFSSLSYSSSLTSGGFQSVCISNFDVEKLVLMPENKVQIFGVNTWFNNSKEARTHMINCSLKFQTIWSKESI